MKFTVTIESVPGGFTVRAEGVAEPVGYGSSGRAVAARAKDYIQGKIDAAKESSASGITR